MNCCNSQIYHYLTHIGWIGPIFFDFTLNSIEQKSGERERVVANLWTSCLLEKFVAILNFQKENLWNILKLAPFCHLSPQDIYNIFFPGFTAGYCTYTVQDLSSNAIVGLYVAQKYQASIFHCLPLTIQGQVNNDIFPGKELCWYGAIRLQDHPVAPGVGPPAVHWHLHHWQVH